MQCDRPDRRSQSYLFYEVLVYSFTISRLGKIVPSRGFVLDRAPRSYINDDTSNDLQACRAINKVFCETFHPLDLE
jgi:hypothetical protein